MLQLELVVVQQPTKESMERNREPTLMEGDEGDDVAIEWRQRIFIVRYDPFHCCGPRAEKALFDQSFHTRVEDIGARPQLL
jgi:hypothetical protein